MRFLVFLFLGLSSLLASGQNYIEYHSQLNKAKLLAAGGQVEASCQLFKLTFEAYEFRYARDCVHAVEIAAHANDTSRTFFFLETGLKQGIPLSYFQDKDGLNWVRDTDDWLKLEASANSLRVGYEKRINLGLRNEINQMFAEDQAIRERYYKWFNFLARPFIARKWRKLNKQQVERLVDITREYGFPGERLIGIDLPSHHPKIDEKQLSAGMPIVILLHHYSKPNPSIDKLLFSQLELGYLFNEHFASICDFEAEFGRKKHKKRGHYGLRFGQRGRKFQYYNAKRKEIGLMTFDEYKKLDSSRLFTKFWKQLK